MPEGERGAFCPKQQEAAGLRLCGSGSDPRPGGNAGVRTASASPSNWSKSLPEAELGLLPADL